MLRFVHRPETRRCGTLQAATVKTRDTIATIYAETAALYTEIKPQLNGAARGYKVLYGPPLVRSPAFFLGLQVGDIDGGPEQGEREGERVTWPAVTEYATAWWPLARKLRHIFEVDFLKTTTGSNINFFRSRGVSTYRTDVPLALRKKCEKFSQERARTLVQVTNPERIIVIGVSALDKLKVKRQFRPVAHGIMRGELWGRPAMATWHLTGQCQAQVTNEQRAVVYQALREFALG